MPRKPSKINVFLTINNQYAKFLAVTIASILLNTKTKVKFFVLDGGISERNKIKIAQLKEIADFDIEYLVIDKNKFAKMPNSSQAHISNETNYRFLMSSLVPEIDKCIFIDADLVLVDDIKKLWDVKIDDYYMAAVIDQAPRHKEITWVHYLPLKHPEKYVNTGVTVMNLALWRKNNIEEKLFENVAKYASVLKFPDQDTLNITLQDKIKYIPLNFNAMPVQRYVDDKQLAFSNPLIVHWAGARKPWVYQETDFSECFWKYARMTPFYEEILFDFHPHVAPVMQSVNHMLSDLEMIKIIKKYNMRHYYHRKYQMYRMLSHITFGKLCDKFDKKRHRYRVKYLESTGLGGGVRKN